MLKVLNVALALVLAGCSSAPQEQAPSGQPPNPMPPITGPRVFVSNEIGGTVSVIDAVARRVIATIPVGKRPRGIRASRDGRTIYVALSGSPMAGPGVDESKLPPPERRFDGIGVIDATTGRLTKILPGGSDPEQFALSADGARLFIANEDAGETTVLDIDSGAIIRTIKVGGEPEGVDLSPDGTVVYVTSEEDNSIFVIDTARLEVVKVIKVGPRPRSTGFVPTAARAYVGAENDASVYVVDSDAHQVIKRIPMASDTLRPMGVVSAPDGKHVYVSTGRGRSVEVIDVETNTVSASLEVGERPWGIAVSSDGQTLYTANGPSNDVSIIDVAKWTVVTRVPVGERPWGVVFVP